MAFRCGFCGLARVYAAGVASHREGLELVVRGGMTGGGCRRACAG